jgi:hypothetical protein
MDDVKVRIPKHLLEQADELLPRVSGSLPVAGNYRMGKISRASLLRFALARGLAAIEVELAARTKQDG